jgi:hypothetical protein
VTVIALLAVAAATSQWWYPHPRRRIDATSPGVRQEAGEIGHGIYRMFEQ